MSFLELMLKRESCRAYDGTKKVSREDLLKIVEAGRLSPSGCNAQPWKFLVVDEEEALAKMRDALVTEDAGTGAPWGDQVNAFIAIVETPAKVMPGVLTHYKDSQRFAQGDIGMAAMNMCYQAEELGLSTCPIGLNEQKKMEKNFGIPEGMEVRLVLAVGYAAEKTEPREKIRKPLEEVCCFNEWK